MTGSNRSNRERLAIAGLVLTVVLALYGLGNLVGLGQALTLAVAGTASIAFITAVIAFAVTRLGSGDTNASASKSEEALGWRRPKQSKGNWAALGRRELIVTMAAGIGVLGAVPLTSSWLFASPPHDTQPIGHTPQVSIIAAPGSKTLKQVGPLIFQLVQVGPVKDPAPVVAISWIAWTADGVAMQGPCDVHLEKFRLQPSGAQLPLNDDYSSHDCSSPKAVLLAMPRDGTYQVVVNVRSLDGDKRKLADGSVRFTIIPEDPNDGGAA
jgi:hypothetical protein